MSMATRMRGWLISALGSSLCVTGQIAQFEVKEDKILIRMSSGETREALAAGVDRNSVRISPDGSRLIWHLEFAGYGHDPQIPVRLWSPSRPEKIEEFRVPTLSRYHRTLRFDVRGFGRSDKPPGPYSPRLFARDVADLLRALRLTAAHVAGISMGGVIAQRVALDYPELVSSLTLISTSS
ncbi:MAG: alpha/beta hydrolase, partial [Bryobacteraceae bacterium]|nr:alpha/beta hydrolase [Bryobacteraceae bacterium]